MSSPSKEASIPVGHRLLTALPPDEYDQLLARSELVHFRKNRILFEAGEGIHYASREHPPARLRALTLSLSQWERGEQAVLTSGMASLLAITEDGSTIEIGTVGREGYIGAPFCTRSD